MEQLPNNLEHHTTAELDGMLTDLQSQRRVIDHMYNHILNEKRVRYVATLRGHAQLELPETD